MWQLSVIYIHEEEFKDAVKAYKYLENALSCGVTEFDTLHKLFIDNYDQLAPNFLEKKKALQFS